MAAPTETYVDPSIAADSGNGTSGDPYGDLQYALNTMTRDATNGDRINIKSGTDEVLTGTLSLATYGTPDFDAPLIFEGYTSTAGDGGIGGIDGNDGDFTVHGGATAVHWLRMHLHNTGTADVIGIGQRASIRECEVNDGDGDGIAIILDESVIDGNHVHDIGAVGINIAANAEYKVTNNYVKNDGTRTMTAGIQGSASATNSEFTRNIISIDSTTNGIQMVNTRGVVANNSVFSNGGTGTGIKLDANSKLTMFLHSNLIEGFSGTGGIGIQIPTGTRQMVAYGKNAVYNCATNYDVDTDDIVDLLGDNESLGASPFAKSGSDTFANRFTYFAPVDTGNVIGGSYQ